MQADTLSPGSQLAGRYRIEDLVGETVRSETWRAVDRVLDRSVSVQVVRSDDDSAAAFLTAARSATAVDDPRFLRVLDAADDGEHAYVVREWARGVSLDTVLQQGPLPTPRATELVREVAEAVASAHRCGVHHGWLDPARVIVKHNGAVRVLGLATDQALRTTGNGPGPTSAGRTAELTDVTALGRLLYACLVARWPGGRDLGLPSAPTEHGRLLRPRQVRAGVDRGVDGVCDRILGSPPRHHAVPLQSAVDVAQELEVLSLAGETPPAFVDADDETLLRGVLPVPPDPGGPPPAIYQVPPPRSGPGAAAPPKPPPPPDRHTGARGLVWVAIVLLVALAALLTYFVGRVGTGVLPLAGDDPADNGATASPPPSPSAAQPVEIAGVSVFDPQGTDGVEHDEEAPFAIDGDPATGWTTQEYYSFPELGNLKSGVGLLVDLSRAQSVRRVEATLVGGPTSVSLLAAPEGAAAPTGIAGLEPVATARDVGEPDSAAEVVLASEEPITTRYLVVWLTKLPPVSPGRYVGTITEVAVVG